MTVALPPTEWGATGIESTVAAIRGEQIPEQVPINTFIVDSDNVNEFSPEDLR